MEKVKYLKGIVIGLLLVMVISFAVVAAQGQMLAQKDPSQDPYAQGNAPTAGGLNADPGPGTYIEASAMPQPPAVVHISPAPPQ